MTYKNESAGFRLSPQQRLRWLSDLPPSSLTLDIKGDLDRQALQQMLENLVAQHEPLRMPLQASSMKVPSQTVLDSSAASALLFFEPHGAPSPAVTVPTGLNATLKTLAQHHYKLHIKTAPLAADRGTLLRMAHALASPPNSVSPNDAEEMTYIQYTAWLYELQADEDAEHGRQHWAEICSTNPPPCDLIYKESLHEQNLSTYATTSTESTWPSAAFSHALNEFCRASGHCPSTVLKTAWAVLLQRLSVGLSDQTAQLILNWVHDCREDYEELEPCWGLFSKALPLQWAPDLNDGFVDALNTMTHRQEEAIEWQEYYAIETAPTAPLSRFGFEWGGQLARYTTGNAARTGELRIEVVTLDAQTQLFDLLLIPEMIASGESDTLSDATAPGYRLNLRYDCTQYSQQAMTTLLEQYQSLVMDALANPSRPLQSLSLHSPSFDRVLEALEAQPPSSPVTPENLFPARFSRQAQNFAHHLALCDDGPYGAPDTYTYGELEVRSNQLAHHLQSSGVGPESRVALFIDRSAHWVTAMLAVLKSGAAFLPIETQQPAARTVTILEAAQPELMLTVEAQHLSCPAGIAQLAIDKISALESYPQTPPNVVLSPDNAAYVLFTSGSTGTPKGVVVAHRQLHNYVTSILSRVSLEPGAKSALATSLAADLSYTFLFPTLLRGGELHVLSRDTTMDPQAWANYQTRHAVDNLKIVPSLLDAWLSHGDGAKVLPQQQLIIGGEPCSRALLQKIRACAPALQIYNHYGPTETTVGVMMHKVEAQVAYRQLPLSDRLNNTRIYLLDNNLKRVAAGQQGELYVAGDNLARGYLCPRQSAERFITDPFSSAGGRIYRTGDLARYRPDGAIEIIGRADRQIKIRGFRIELDEIEALLASLTAVRQAAVVVVPREQGDLQIFAFISLHPEQQASLAQIQGQLQDRLPDYMLPTLRLVEALPLLINGKLDRQTLCEQAKKMLHHVCSAPPRTPFEALLTELWAEVLGVEKIGVDDDFFAVGGHSLAAVKLASRLQKTLSTPVTVNAVFTAPTVSKFVTLVQQELQLSPLVDLSLPKESQSGPGPAEPILFCFHPSTGHVQDYRVLAEPLKHWQLKGLQASYLVDESPAARTIDALAKNYVTHLRQAQPDGPYYLLGWSLGGLIAMTAAAHLESAGERVAFLGVVDAQLSQETSTENIEELLQSASEELDSDSRARFASLPLQQRDALVSQLGQVQGQERIAVLARWAQQQGLQLESESWEHLQADLQRRAHSQRLIGSFKPPRLGCTASVWWAKETLASRDTAPVNWQHLTGNGDGSAVDIIDANHFTILKQPIWQQQLRDHLDSAKQTHASQHAEASQRTASVTTDEII